MVCPLVNRDISTLIMDTSKHKIPIVTLLQRTECLFSFKWANIPTWAKRMRDYITKCYRSDENILVKLSKVRKSLTYVVLNTDNPFLPMKLTLTHQNHLYGCQHQIQDC